MTKPAKVIPSEDIGGMLFAQLHPYHQDFFNSLLGEHSRIELRNLPHYTLWRDQQSISSRKSTYYRYLKESWKYYFPTKNSHEARLNKLKNYVELRDDIEKNGVQQPVKILTTPDGARLLIDGNHRASIAYHLGISLPYVEEDIETYILRTVHNKDEFYGTKNADRPYQSIFYKNKEMVKGRRRDIFERFQKIDIISDIRGKSVADIGCNIAMSSMLAWHYGAKEVVSMEYSPKIAASALRLSTLLNAKITVRVQDLGERITKPKKYDTVFCFSLDAHVKNKQGLEANIRKITGKTLYLEGHEGRTEKDYQFILRHFSKVELLGYNKDGIHSKKSTRPFFKCTV